MQRHRDPLRRRCSANFSSDLLHTITTLIVVTVNLSLVACQAVADGPGNAERKPNLVFILADDKYGHVDRNAEFDREIRIICNSAYKFEYRPIAGVSVQLG